MQEYKEIPRNINRKKEHFSHNWSGPTDWFDGAAESSGLNSGARGIIKLNGHCSYKWYINCGQGTNNRAELLGVWALLTLASRLSIYSILVQGDSKIIIDWLKEKGRLQVVKLECWKLRIKNLIGLFQPISFTHVYREDNEVADRLSKQALLKDPKKIYYFQCVGDHEGPLRTLEIY
jgi:ribonuclease HI